MSKTRRPRTATLPQRIVRDRLPPSPVTSGVYAIRNTVVKKIYVGSAVYIARRWRRHRVELRSNTHKNKYLQRAWNKYGEDNFEFFIIEKCLPETCIEREQYWIDHYTSSDETKGYNLSPTAGSSLGIKRKLESIPNYKEGARKREENPISRAKRQAAVARANKLKAMGGGFITSLQLARMKFEKSRSKKNGS